MRPAKIGKLTVKDPVCLAPMAGTSSVAFREICHEMGAAYAPTELVSARSIRFSGLEKSYRYLEISPAGEGLTAIQLFGTEPEDFTDAIGKILDDERLSSVDIIDINMGCPVKKVIKIGAGSALMKDPKRASDIVKAAVSAAGGRPVTVKTRIGFDSDCHGSPDFVKILADSGASMVCVHGRTASQMYSGEADIDAIALMGQAAREAGVTFFANGDIKDFESAKNMLDKTGADGLMVGRGAQGNPWVFAQIKAGFDGTDYFPPTDEERKRMLVRELKATATHLPENVAVREMRPAMCCYIKGMRGAAGLKNELCRAQTISQVEDLLWT